MGTEEDVGRPPMVDGQASRREFLAEALSYAGGAAAFMSALPPGVVYRPVVEEELGEFPNVRKRFTPRPRMHCEDPPCTPVCPVSATYKRPDGIIIACVDGHRIRGHELRRGGLCTNAVCDVDPVVGGVTLTDPVGASASFFDTRVALEVV